MSTKRSRRIAALDSAKAESDRRYPGPDYKSRSLRIGFVAGAMWHREKSTSSTEQEPS